MNRQQQLQKLDQETFDLCVIGAGASGAGVALDAALRGYKVVLIDSGDFCGETSSKSTKLIHGGVRYLEQAFKKLDFSQLKQVRHGLKERKYIYSNATYHTRKLGIITPVFSFWEGLYYFIGLKIYGLFSLKDHFPSARWLKKKEMLTESPNITTKAHSGVIYYDGQLDDARYVMALVKSAAEIGVTTINYCQLTNFTKNNDGKLEKGSVINQLTEEKHEINARVFINCTGPFSDSIRSLANPEETPRIVQSKGVHIVLPNIYFPGNKALLIPKTSDGRLVFIIPFRHHVMIGTTDTPYEKTNVEPLLEKEELDYLLKTASPYLTKTPTSKDITAGFGGVRPLLMPHRRNANNTKALLRDHEVELDEHSGLVSLLGGKWTTYRLMAEDTLNTIDTLWGKQKLCKTQDYKLAGNKEIITKPDGIDDLLWNQLLSYYGTYTLLILSIDGGKFKRIHPEQVFLEAEVRYTCRNEMVQEIRDFMARRTRWEILDWKSCYEASQRVGEIIGEELNWSKEYTNLKIKEYQDLIIKFQKEIY